MGRHLPAYYVILALAICLSYFASSGASDAWQLLTGVRVPAVAPYTDLNAFFDVQGESILEGRWEVPCQEIGREAFIYDGKCYTYFGISPALLRIPLNAAFPYMHGRWTSVLSLVAALVNLLAAYLLFLQARKALALERRLSGYDVTAAMVFLIAVGIGSTNLFLLNAPNIYHEASLLGGAFGLASFCALIRFLEKQTRASLLIAFLVGFLAINARPLNGGGPVLALTAIFFLLIVSGLNGKFWLGARPSKLTQVFLSPEIATRVSPPVRGLSFGLALVVLASPFVILYLKFGTPVPDFSHYIEVMNDPVRLARTGGDSSRFGNIPFNLSYYFTPLASSFSDNFPWITMVSPDWEALERFPHAKIDWLEARINPILTMPPFFVFGAIGLWTCIKGGADIRPFRIVMVCAFVAGSLVLGHFAASQRYIHDFFPFLVVSAAVGVAYISSISARAVRLGALIVLIFLTGLGIYVNMVAVYQSDFSSLNIKNAMADTLIAAREIFSRDAEVRRLYPNLLQNATDMGDVKAQYAVAVIYEKGESVSRNHDAAMRWYEASALGGLADAQFRLGLHYMRGDVRRPHEKKLGKSLAWAWLEMAARRGIPDAERMKKSLDRTMNSDDLFWAGSLAKMFSKSIRKR